MRPPVDCDTLYQMVIGLDVGSGYDLFALAQCFTNGYDPEKLRQLLLSDDLGMVSDGLFILAETTGLLGMYEGELNRIKALKDDDLSAKANALLHALRSQ